MYVNGLGFRAIERVTGVNHNTVIRWVRKTAMSLPNAPQAEEIPEITEIDELQTFGFAKPPAEGCRNAPAFVGQKKPDMDMERAHHGAVAPSSAKQTGRALPFVPVPSERRSDGESHRANHWKPGILAWVLLRSLRSNV